MKLRNVLVLALVAGAVAVAVSLRPRRRAVLVNERTGVFHDPGCRFAPDPERAARSASAEAASAAGYRPCGACMG